MKTAKSWQESWHGTIWAVPTAEQIQAIQEDAYRAGLLRAAELCRLDGEMHDLIAPSPRIQSKLLAESIEELAKEGLP